MKMKHTLHNLSARLQRPVTTMVLLVTVLTLSACASTPKTRVITPKVPEVAVNGAEKQPLDIGVYYSDQLKTYRTRNQVYKNFEARAVGKPSVEMFDNVLPKLFHSVTPVQSVQLGNGTSEGLDCILEPRIEDVDYPPETGRKNNGHHITYRFILYRPDGEPVSTWIVTGYSPKKTFRPERNMQIAAQKLVRSVSTGARETGLDRCKGSRSLTHSVNGISASATVASGDKVLDELSFANTRILVMNVSVRNSNKDELVVRDWAMSLTLPDGRVLHQPPLYKVISDVHTYKDNSTAISVFLNPAFGAIAGMSTSLKMRTVKAQLAGKLQKKTFGVRRVRGNIAQSGYVVFELPNKEENLEGATLTIWFSDERGDMAEKVTVPLHGTS
jgi:hypothetical protein